MLDAEKHGKTQRFDPWMFVLFRVLFDLPV